MTAEHRHIALFVRYLPVGGIQKVMVRLANEFVQRGFRVDLIVAKGKGALTKDVSSEVRIIDLDKRRVWTALPALMQYLKSEQPDVLFSAEAPVNLVAVWARLLSSQRTRLIVSVHSNMTQYAKSGEVWYGRIMPYMIRQFYPLADKIVASSKGVLGDLSRDSPKIAQKGCVIYPLIDQQSFQEANGPVRHPWLTDNGVPVILGVGRLTRQKNFDLLLRSFASLQEKRDARLIILGDGNQRESLARRVDELDIGDHADLHGFVGDPYPYMKKASLFVLSSDFEGFGIVIVEALACGCPVVSTDCPSGPREILDDGKWGGLVPVGDEAALTEAMDEALSKTHDPDRLRQRARDFSVDAAVDNHLDVLFPDE